MKTMDYSPVRPAAVSSSAVAPMASSRRRCQRNRWRAQYGGKKSPPTCARAAVLAGKVEVRTSGLTVQGLAKAQSKVEGDVFRRPRARVIAGLRRSRSPSMHAAYSSRSSALPREMRTKPQGLGRSRLGVRINAETEAFELSGQGLPPPPWAWSVDIVRRTGPSSVMCGTSARVGSPPVCPLFPTWPLSGHEGSCSATPNAHFGLPGPARARVTVGRHHDRRDGAPLDGSGAESEGSTCSGAPRVGVLQPTTPQPHHFRGRGPALRRRTICVDPRVTRRFPRKPTSGCRLRPRHRRRAGGRLSRLVHTGSSRTRPNDDTMVQPLV